MSDNNLITISQLAVGLLDQFSSLKELEHALAQLLSKQTEMLDKGIRELDHYQSGEEIAEISLMMKKMNFYRLKLKSLRSDMLYIFQRVTELKKKAIDIQNLKVDAKADRIRMYDYEAGLIATTNK